MCIAAVDRYCSTCRSVRRRSWSSVKVSKITIPNILVFVLLLNIPDLLFSNCPIKVLWEPPFSEQYEIYIAYFLTPVMRLIIPVAFLSALTYLTYRNLKIVSATRLRLQETQLTTLSLLQIISFQLVSIPLIVQQLYFLITKTHAKNITRTVIEYLVQSIALSINNTYQCTNFYAYYLCSANYRNMVNKLLFDPCCCKRSTMQSRLPQKF